MRSGEACVRDLSPPLRMGLSLNEEQALVRYLHRFEFTARDVDANSAHHMLVQGAVIREAAEGVVPDRLGDVRVPFNLMKSEQLVWVIADVDCLEVKVRRDRRGTSHGLSIRVAKGVYYRPGMFRSQPIEWEETVHEDTGLLASPPSTSTSTARASASACPTTASSPLIPTTTASAFMRDARTARPQTFRTRRRLVRV